MAMRHAPSLRPLRSGFVALIALGVAACAHGAPYVPEGREVLAGMLVLGLLLELGSRPGCGAAFVAWMMPVAWFFGSVSDWCWDGDCPPPAYRYGRLCFVLFAGSFLLWGTIRNAVEASRSAPSLPRARISRGEG